MVRNGSLLLNPPGSKLSHAPIVGMIEEKRREHGVSYGLSEAGYDIRIKQDVTFRNRKVSNLNGVGFEMCSELAGMLCVGRFCIASAIEEFDMPLDLMGIVHDKSTWARRGLSVFNTVIESGWKGYLTLELVYHGHEELHIPAGAGIAQVIFHELTCPADYGAGKYQNQPDRPVEARSA
jgi:dCTP deaminase